MSALWRRTSFAAALAAGLGVSQAPEYVQQYRQRLGGAIDELTAAVVAFDADSRAEGMTHDQGVARLEASPDIFVRQRGERMQEETERLARLRRQAARLQGDLPLTQVFGMALDLDPKVARGAFDDFKPALPMTADGALSAAIGFLGALLGLRLCALPFGRRAKKAGRTDFKRA